MVRASGNCRRVVLKHHLLMDSLQQCRIENTGTGRRSAGPGFENPDAVHWWLLCEMGCGENGDVVELRAYALVVNPMLLALPVRFIRLANSSREISTRVLWSIAVTPR